MISKIPVVSIVGRPNVGKSTLFNRLSGEKLAVVEDLPGVTRDRNFAFLDGFTIPCMLVDTGGFETDPESDLDKLVVEQTKLAIEESDIVLALFDGDAGLMPADEEVVQYLRRSGKKVFFAVNKVDGVEQIGKVSDFYQLGLQEISDISALHGQGVSTFFEEILNSVPEYDLIRKQVEEDKKERARLLEEAEEMQAQAEGYFGKADEELITEDDSQAGIEEEIEPDLEEEVIPTFAPVYLPGEDEDESSSYIKDNRLRALPPKAVRKKVEVEPTEGDEPTPEVELIKVAIIGRPNVGKSTLLNTLLGEQRAIASAIAGTTRDSINADVTVDGQRFMLVDTAGLRKKGKVTDTVERYSTMRAVASLSLADVAVIMIDAVEGPTEQDAKIAGLAHDQGRGVILVVNKWDAVADKDHKSVKEYEIEVRRTIKFLHYAPIVFVSALTGKRCNRILEIARDVGYQRVRRISTGRLNTILERCVKKVSLSNFRGRPIKLYYGAQVATSPPRIALFFNYPRKVHFSSLRFMKNAIRDEFGFTGTDVKLILKRH